MIKGYIDRYDEGIIYGWAYNKTCSDPCIVEIYINQKYHSSGIANYYRPSLVNKGIHVTGNCEYRVPVKINNNNEYIIDAKVKDSNNKYHTLENSPLIRNSKPQIFYQHIAKTGGTTVNDILSRNFDKKYIRVHIEGNKDWSKTQIEKFQTYNYISGHIGIKSISKFINLNNFYNITLLRDPIQQLISHINWVYNISEDPTSKFFLSHTQEIKELSLFMRELDFNNEKHVQSFVKNIPNEGRFIFDNCQTRYFLGNPRVTKVDKQSYKEAKETMKLFDHIGTLTNFDKFISQIHKSLKMINEIKSNKVLNSRKNKSVITLTKNNEIILKPLTHYDQLLYNKIIKND